MLVERITSRIDARLCQLLKQDNRNAVSGVINTRIHKDIKKLSLVREFLPRWSISQVKQAECYIRDNFGI